MNNLLRGKQRSRKCMLIFGGFSIGLMLVRMMLLDHVITAVFREGQFLSAFVSLIRFFVLGGLSFIFYLGFGVSLVVHLVYRFKISRFKDNS